MNDTSAPGATSYETPRPKKAYSAPALQTLGSVALLTAGSGGKNGDGKKPNHA